MDATKTILKQTALFLVTALLFATTAGAQTLSVSQNSVNLSSSVTTGSVDVSSASGSSVSFTVSKGTGNSFYNVTPTSGTASAGSPVTLYITLASTLGCNPSCSGTITVHPSTGTDVAIAVTFSPGGGGGGNFIAISPTSVTLSVASVGQSQTGSVTLSTSTGAAAACTASSNQTWLTLGATSFNLSSVGYALSFTANSTFLAANSVNTATVTISCPAYSASNSFTVTFNVGTTSSNFIVISRSSVPMSVTTVGQTTTDSVTLSTSTGAAAVCTISSNQSWLTFAGFNSQVTMTLLATPQTLNMTANSTFLAANSTNTATATVSCPAFSAQNSFTVVFTVGTGSAGSYTVSPASVVMGSNAGAATTCSDVSASSSCTLSVTSSLGLTQYSAFVNSITGGNWLYLNSSTGVITGNVASGLTLSLNPSVVSSLTPGSTYAAQVVLCNPSNCVQTNYTLLTVSLQVGTGGTLTGLAAPSTLSFAYQTGNTVPQYQTVLVNATSQYTETPSVSTSQQWLKVFGTTIPQTLASSYLQVSVDPTGLSAGTYQGTININTGTVSQNITVNFLVSASRVVQASPGSVYLFGNTQQSNLMTLAASDNSAVSVNITSSASWITVSPTSVGTPGSLAVVVNPATLCNGLNAGTITLSTTSGTVANPTETIPVVALVTGSTNTNCTTTGNLTFSPTSFTFTTPNSTTFPTGQTLTVSSTAVTQATVATITNSGGNWLLINGGAYPNATLVNIPVSLTISTNPTGLTPGTYTGYLQFIAGGITQNVNVTLTVGGGSGNISVSPTSVTFSAQAGTTPNGQTLTVSKASGTTNEVQFTTTISTSSGGAWLTATASGSTLASGASLTTPATITLNVNPSGLTAGQQYSGSVVLTPNGGTTITVPVTFTILAAVSATPATLNFSYRIGDAAPAAQAISVSGATGATFSATAAVQSGGNWLSVTPASGTVPASLSVSLNTSAITTSGTFTGTITVAGTGGSTGSTTINVTLTATAPLPTITQIGNAASYVGGAISPGEIITIFGKDLGPTPAVSSPKIDSGTGLVATNLGGVQVLINGFACPMIYASNSQISAVVPYEVARFLSATILVQYLGQSSNGISAAVSPTAPGIFTANASGTGPGAILNSNLSQNSPGNPANRGDVVAIYMTGEGQTAPSGITGKVTSVSSTGPLTPQPLLPIGVLIDGQPAAVTFYGEAPGLISGVLQVNVVIPAGARSGNLPLVVNIGNGASQAGVTVSVR